MRTIFFASLIMAIVSCNAQQNKVQKTVINQIKNDTNMHTDTAIFGEGCFWCTEAFFQRLKGVISVTSGYGGGHVDNPTYEQVCDKTTGHVELAKIIYNPSEITYDELLEVFWKTHDPTTVDQQGADKAVSYTHLTLPTNREV